MGEQITRVYGVQFGLLCLSSFLFFASFNMIIPELPDYLSSLGGAEYKGLIISLFTLTAGFSRPFSGRLADTIGRIPVMIVGGAVCVVTGFLYPLTGTVAAFLLLRFIHGFSTGFTPTGTAAYVADVVPPGRRGDDRPFGQFRDGCGACGGRRHCKPILHRYHVLRIVSCCFLIGGGAGADA